MIRHFTGMVQTAVAIVRWNRPRSQRSALVHSSPTAALSVSETKRGLMSSVQIPEEALSWPLEGGQKSGHSFGGMNPGTFKAVQAALLAQEHCMSGRGQ